MNLPLLNLFILLFCFLSSYSQDYFEKYYPLGNLNLHNVKIIHSNEKGFYILCYSEPYGEYGVQLYFINRIDSSGNLLFSRQVETGDNGIGYAKAADFVLAPDSFIYFAGNEMGCMGDGTVIKIDNSNNIIWDRIYTLNIETYGAQFYSICSANNSDQLVGGAMVSNNCYVVAPYICRMSSNGSTIWEERWDSLYPGQSINKIELFHDSTYLVHLDSVTVQINDSGQILSTAFPTGAFILIDTGGFVSFNNHQISRLSDNLSIIWQSPYYSDRVINDLTVDSRGNYFVTGKTDTAGHGMFISKIDPSGNILFTKLYGGDLFDEGSNIIVADSDHVIAAGSYQAHIKTITSHHYYDCLLYTTYSHPIILAKLKTDPLSPLQCLSSTGNYFICNNDSIILTAPAGFIYLWNTGSTSQNIIVDTSGSFEVTITDTSGNSEILPVFNSYKYPFPSLPHFADSVFTQCSGYFNLCLGVPYSDTIADRSYCLSPLNDWTVC